MPLRRRHSSGQVEDSSQHLEGIAETAETLEEEELRQEITCSAPKVRSTQLSVSSSLMVRANICLGISLFERGPGRAHF